VTPFRREARLYRWSRNRLLQTLRPFPAGKEPVVRTHVTIIAWLNILLSLPFLLIGLALFVGFLLTGAIALPALPILGGLGVLLLFLFALFAIPGLILGWGLLNYAPWARIFGIVISIINIVNISTLGIGSILGIYSLIVLLNPETAALFEGRQYQTR
jgi:hypothetical protein